MCAAFERNNLWKTQSLHMNMLKKKLNSAARNIQDQTRQNDPTDRSDAVHHPRQTNRPARRTSWTEEQ